MDYEDLKFSQLQPNVYVDIAAGKPVANIHSYSGVSSGTDLAVQVMIASTAAWERYLALPHSVRDWERKTLDKTLQSLTSE